MAAPMHQSIAPMAKMMKKEKCKGDAYYREDDSGTQSKLKFFQQFLKYSPLQLFNLKPNQNGVVEATLDGLSNYSSLYIVACDKDSVASRNMSVNGLVQQTTSKLMTKDLTQQKHDSKEKVGLTINKEVICVHNGDSKVIEDV